MNLKFWKRKPENDEFAKGGPDSEAAPAKADLLSRIKARVAALTGRFGSPPPFKAEVPEAEAEQPAGKEAAEPETVPPAGALARIQALLMSLMARFRAAPEGDTPPTGKDVLPEAGQPAGKEVAEPESVPPAGVLARAQALLMPLVARLRAVPEGETPPAGRMALIVAGMLLLLLLLGAFGYAAWTIVLSSPDPESDVAELIADDAPLPIVMPESAPSGSGVPAVPVGEETASAVPVAETGEGAPEESSASSVAAAEPVAEPPVPQPPLTEVEALRRKNAELQAELDALKKSQRSAGAVKMYPGGRGAPAGGVATVGNSDPAAAAATLKEAIEAMNNGNNYRQDPAR